MRRCKKVSLIVSGLVSFAIIAAISCCADLAVQNISQQTEDSEDIAAQYKKELEKWQKLFEEEWPKYKQKQEAAGKEASPVIEKLVSGKIHNEFSKVQLLKATVEAIREDKEVKDPLNEALSANDLDVACVKLTLYWTGIDKEKAKKILAENNKQSRSKLLAVIGYHRDKDFIDICVNNMTLYTGGITCSFSDNVFPYTTALKEIAITHKAKVIDAVIERLATRDHTNTDLTEISVFLALRLSRDQAIQDLQLKQARHQNDLAAVKRLQQAIDRLLNPQGK